MNTVRLNSTSECMQTLASIQIAYKRFIACHPSDPDFKNCRNNYFLTIDKLHTLLFSNSNTYMHRDTYLSQAEKVLYDGGDFKYYLFARYRLNKPAKQYVNAFEKLNKTLSAGNPSIFDVSSNICEIEKAHSTFANRFAIEYETLEKYQRLGEYFKFLLVNNSI